MDQAGQHVANAILAIDTVWGGDVMCASGTGRFIADSWFSDEPLPLAYTLPAANRIRQSGGVTAKQPDHAAIKEYLEAIEVPGAIEGVKSESEKIGGLRGQYLAGLSSALSVMWDLALEVLGNGPAVPYDRCVQVATGRPPEPSRPEAKRERIAELLSRAGSPRQALQDC